MGVRGQGLRVRVRVRIRIWVRVQANRRREGAPRATVEEVNLEHLLRVRVRVS